MKSYISLFLKSINDDKSNLSINDNGRQYNLKQIRNFLLSYVAFLKNLKLKKNSKIILLGERNIESILFFHTLLVEGFIPILIDNTLNNLDIKRIVQGRKVFVSSIKTHYLNSIKVPKVYQLKFISNVNSKVVSKKTQNKTLFILHTSGTTGIHKLVPYSNENIVWAVNQYINLYNLERNQNTLFALPFHYSFGIISCCLSPIIAKQKIILLPQKKESAVNVAKLIEEQKVNILVITPFFYNRLSKLNLNNYNFSSVKICDSGGETLPIDLINKFKRQTGTVITEGYGLTETSSLTHFLTPDNKGNLRLGSVGRPRSDAQCKIVNTSFNELSVGEIGELIVKGPMVIRSYENKKNNVSAFYKRWFITGDLFYKDKDDFYYYIGRKKEVIKINIKTYSLVSNKIFLINQLEEVTDAVFKFVNSNELVIYINPKNKSMFNSKIIENKVKRILSKKIKIKISIKFVEFVPRTSTGKVQRQKLIE